MSCLSLDGVHLWHHQTQTGKQMKKKVEAEFLLWTAGGGVSPLDQCLFHTNTTIRGCQELLVHVVLVCAVCLKPSQTNVIQDFSSSPIQNICTGTHQTDKSRRPPGVSWWRKSSETNPDRFGWSLQDDQRPTKTQTSVRKRAVNNLLMFHPSFVCFYQVTLRWSAIVCPVCMTETRWLEFLSPLRFYFVKVDKTHNLWKRFMLEKV